MFTITETGGLVAAWHTQDTDHVDKRLRQLDPNLFLDPEFDPRTGVYWTVKYWNGERAPEPVSPILEWREPTGVAKPMSEAVVHEVQRMMRRGPISIREIADENLRVRTERRDRAAEMYGEIVRDFERHDQRTHTVHRSVGLRMARDKMRARGEKV